MSYPLYIAFGVIPSFIWLLFYLRKDVHPESNRMILLVFLLGMLVAPLAAVFECVPSGISEKGLDCFSFSFFDKSFPGPLGYLLYSILAVAMVEELVKYSVFKFKVLKNSALDEPIDVMLYMIISALGFAALENILILSQFASGPVLDRVFFNNVIGLSLFRFLGATFLHALTSALFGYFLALSFFEPKRKVFYFLTGLSLAVVFHGLYNFSIMEIEGSFKFLLPAIILLFLAVFVTFCFRKLQKMKGVCKI